MEVRLAAAPASKGSLPEPKGSRGIAEEHHSETGESRVELTLSKIVRLCVHLPEGHCPARIRARATARDLEHRGRNINADHRSGGPYPVRERQGALTATTPNVDNVLALGRLQRIDRRESQRFDLAVEQLMVLRPGPACDSIPVFDLCGVRRGYRVFRHVNVLAGAFG